MTSHKKSNGWKLGWLVASGALSLSLLSPSFAWALDLDREISKHNVESAQILETLGSSRSRAVSGPSVRKAARGSKVQLKLVRSTKRSRRG